MKPAFGKRYGQWAIITGASSGIGREFARQIAAREIHVVLVARRLDRLNALAVELTARHGVQAMVVVADLSAPGFLDIIAERTRTLDVGLLVNCAGFGLTGEFLDSPLQDQLRLFDVDCRAPLALTHHFGHVFAARGSGGIINVASAASFMPMPYWAQYSAAKVYLLQLTEALWYEFRRRGVDVLALCPGNTRTEFAGIAHSKMSGGMDVQPVVSAALRGLGRKPRVIPGVGNLVASWLPRFIPRKASIFLGAMVAGK